VTLPDSLDAKHQGMVDKMAALTGSEFDAAYVADSGKTNKWMPRSSKLNLPRRRMRISKASWINPFPVVGEHLKAHHCHEAVAALRTDHAPCCETP